MPICGVCGARFPNRTEIDGRKVTLCKRKYCLNCSPYKKHNTKKLEKDRESAERELVCDQCGRLFEYNRSNGSSLRLCGSCKTKNRNKALKQRAVEMLGGKCQICGYDRCNEALTFHHRNPEEKEFGVGNNYNRKWEDLDREIRKCVLVCMNCHAEVHAGVAQW